MRKIGQAGLQLIMSFEGCRLTAYKAMPTEQYYTIGYGHYGSDVKKGMQISSAQAEAYLIADCEKFAAYVDKKEYVPIELNDNQRDALISFTYNCGPGNLKKLCAGRTHTQIADKLLLYNKAGGKVVEGLQRRRSAERELFLLEVKNGAIVPAQQEQQAQVAAAKNTCEPAKSKNKTFAGKYKVTAKSGLKLRIGASTKKSIITVIPSGAAITCWGYHTGNWYLVEYGKYAGYVSRNYLQKI